MTCVKLIIGIVALSSTLAVPLSVLDESRCSKFEYEYRVLEKIINLENKNAEYERKQKVIELQNQELMKIVNEQIHEMKLIKQEIAEERINMTSMIEKLERANMEQIEDLKNMTDTVRNHTDDYTEFKISAESAISDCSKRSKTHVSFSVKLGSNKKYTTPETILFKHILNNDGDAYNPNTGIFTAPVDGKYWFSASITVYNPAFARVYMMKDNQEITMAYPDRRGYNSKNYETATTSTVMDLKAGDAICCKWTQGTTSTPFSIEGRQSNSFSGALLHQY